MKRILFFVSILVLLAFTSNYVESTSVIITPNSELVINGKTNVNSFTCEYDVLRFNRPIPIAFKRVNDRIVFEKATLVLNNTCFDCGGMGINADFQELLKSESYPEIYIDLKEISADPLKESKIQALLDLNISGVSKSYTMPVKLDGENTLLVTGVLRLNIRDFNLEPPKKALGLIVVKDTIEIKFNLKIKEH
ncbi:YceI family protein [Flavobacteriaceae bacterium GSB9]|nr:YceI family protein [Flavobacteriaceae bacterium GSB9]